jgi:hypothetical protein
MIYVLQVFDHNDANTNSSPEWINWVATDSLLRLEVIKEFLYEPDAKIDRRKWRILDSRTGDVIRDYPV